MDSPWPGCGNGLRRKNVVGIDIRGERFESVGEHVDKCTAVKEGGINPFWERGMKAAAQMDFW